jgi:hypothetical protein
MPSLTASYQQYQCPEWFAEELKRIGGVNRYDKANFIIRWGMGGEDECYMRSGGHWHVEGEPSFKGYRDLLVGGGTPSWMLMQWQDALSFGTPESYYVGNIDDETGMQNLGEYPYSGKYVLLYNMCWRDFKNGKLHIEAMPLNSFVLNIVVPIIMQARDISWEKTKAALREQQEKEDKDHLRIIEDAMRDAAVPFKGPVSYAKQGCRTHYIDKRVEQMSRHWNRMVNNAKTLGRGLSVHSENPTK